MSETPVEATTGADRLNDALVRFTGAVGSAVEGICSYGLTIGDSYVPFNPDEDDEDCTEDDVACSQVWVRVMGINPVSSDSWDNDCATVFRIDLEVGVLRCFDIPARGEAPTASEVLVAATQSMDDMNAIYCAAMGEEVWNAIDAGDWAPLGPMGGQYGGSWVFTVEL